ncbi:hypothetical protein [Nocardia puris]|uniref:hypothetical protein n=1 Tax=Nocardia puris TaxID=208602 RepID=UPI002B4B3670|nr:hypothetical protein [Nocardia puris]
MLSQVRWTVSRQGDGQAGTQQSVGCDAGEVPSQQIGCEMAQVGPELGGGLGAVDASYGTWIDIGIETRCGTSTNPITGMTPGGRGFDHRGRHGVLAHAQPEGEAGIVPVRESSAHQHSPGTNGTPNLCSG